MSYSHTPLHLMAVAALSASLMTMATTATCGGDKEPEPQPEPEMSTQDAGVQGAIMRAVPAQLMTPPAMMSPSGFSCNGEITLQDGRRDTVVVKYQHECAPLGHRGAQ